MDRITSATRPRVPAHDAPQRGIGFQRRRIDAERPPLDQRGIGQPLQHPREHGLMRLHVDQAPGPQQGVEWSGGASCSSRSRKWRMLSESAARHAMARSESRPSK